MGMVEEEIYPYNNLQWIVYIKKWVILILVKKFVAAGVLL